MAPPAVPWKATVIGLVSCEVFQQCTEAVEYLSKERRDEFVVEVLFLLPFEFHRRRRELLTSGRLAPAGGDADDVVVVPEDGAPCLTGAEFIAQVTQRTDFRLFDLPREDPQSYHSLAHRAFLSDLRARGNTYCWMAVDIDGVPKGRLLFELFAKTVPRTCENFMHLCRGDVEPVHHHGQPITRHYKGTTFFRVVKGGFVQAGDVTGDHRGNGGYSCYGPTFPDESFEVKHDAPGVLGMCNDGEHTNASSFYITLAKTGWMNGCYVAFGRLVDGYEVLDAIAAVETKHNQSPQVPVTITDCGEIALE